MLRNFQNILCTASPCCFGWNFRIIGSRTAALINCDKVQTEDSIIRLF